MLSFICLEYIQELNDTGSFPDESEKTAMCFIKCFLQTTGVWTSDDKPDKEKTVSIYQLDNGEVVEDCSNETCEPNN